MGASLALRIRVIMCVMKNSLKELLWLSVVFALAATLRYAWIEPAQIGFHCLAYDAPWWCSLRSNIIHLTAIGVFGGVSLIAGIATTFLRWRWLARFAMWCGIAGLVLYNYEFGVIGLLLGALVLTRPKNAHATQQT